jgi:hypothetical protein
MATYHNARHHLTVHSGMTDTLTLLSPHGTHFAVANDGHRNRITSCVSPATMRGLVEFNDGLSKARSSSFRTPDLAHDLTVKIPSSEAS